MSIPAAESPPGDGDAALLHRVASGDRDALAALYDRQARVLYATALRILNDAAEAEDIVHDVFVALWTKACEFDASRGSAIAWTLTLTRNRAIDRLRSRKRRGDLLQASEWSAPQPGLAAAAMDSAENLWHQEKAVVVRRAVGGLPADQRSALELAFFGGLTQQEIAARLQEPLGTIKARIRRGLLKLRDEVAHCL